MESYGYYTLTVCNPDYRLPKEEYSISRVGEEVNCMNKTVPVVISILVLGAGAYFVINRASAVSQNQMTAVVANATSTASMKSFTVSGTEFAFSPNTLSVNKGDTVKITFTNNGTLPHNFTITELAVKSKTIMPGQSDTVTFIADKAGTFVYFCSVPGHKDKGMVGTFTVI